MRGNFFLFLALLVMSATHVQAQDVDIFQRTANDQYRLPQIPRAMTFREFDLLGTSVRMQDIFASAVFPGYIHFRIYEKKKGYWLMGMRAAGYAGLGYLTWKNRSIWWLLLNPGGNSQLDPSYKTDTSIAYLSAGLILGTFLYDWLHGRYLLQKKQLRIRYKYAPVAGLQTYSFNGHTRMGWQAGIRLTF